MSLWHGLSRRIEARHNACSLIYNASKETDTAPLTQWCYSEDQGPRTVKRIQKGHKRTTHTHTHDTIAPSARRHPSARGWVLVRRGCWGWRGTSLRATLSITCLVHHCHYKDAPFNTLCSVCTSAVNFGLVFSMEPSARTQHSHALSTPKKVCWKLFVIATAGRSLISFSWMHGSTLLCYVSRIETCLVFRGFKHNLGLWTFLVNPDLEYCKTFRHTSSISYG